MQAGPTFADLNSLLALRGDAKSLDLSSRKRVQTDIAGMHLSGFRGRGMDFDEHRVYVAGDDVRAIDWRVSARTGQTHIKRFKEERERPVYLLVDFGPSMFFATRGVFKSVLAAQAASLLGWAAVANNDRIGGLLVSAQPLREVRPSAGRKGLLALLHAAVELQDQTVAEPTAPDWANALMHLQRLARGGAVVIVLSDFQTIDAASLPLLQKLARRCELLVGLLSDPFERDLKAYQGLPVTDANQKNRWFIKKHSKTASANALDHAWLQRWFIQSGAHCFHLDTALPALPQLQRALGAKHQQQVVA